MKPQHIMLNLRWSGRVLAWSALMVITLLLALLLQALAASALVAPGPAARANACTSSAGAALADRDTCGHVF